MYAHAIDEGRRDFLKNLAVSGVAGMLGCAAGSRAAIAAIEPEANEDPYGVEVLEEPIILAAGSTLEGRSFVLSPDFASASHNSIIWVAGDDVTIRDVRVIGSSQWLKHWNQTNPAYQRQPGAFGKTFGIRAHSVRGLTIERVSLEGLPKAGIAGFGWANAIVRDVSIRHCFSGVNLLYYEPNVNVTIERVRISDTWGPSGDRSRARPGGWIGGDGLALNSLRDSTITDCVATGEMYGAFKMTNPHRVTVRGLRGCGFQVQGIAGGAAGDAMEPAADVLIEDCVFDKGLGYSASVHGACGVQITHYVAAAYIRRCLLNAAGTGGHGIQVTDRSHARIERCTIQGFNGIRGTTPAHALDIAPGSVANSDFAAVNTFIDQKRICLDRNVVSK